MTKKTFQKNQIHPVELPLVEYASQTYYLISTMKQVATWLVMMEFVMDIEVKNPLKT